MRKAIQEQKKCCVIVRNYRKNGTLFWNEISISPIFDQQENVIYFIGVLTDVSERKRADEELERVQSSVRQMNRELYRLNHELSLLANVDGLTGVANRRCFDEYFDQEWNRLIQEQLPLSLILADLDFFKLFNDTYLHLKGDDCLKTIAQTINSCVHRSTDLVARSGGEEFAILLPNTPQEEAIKIAEIIRKKIHQLQIPHQKSSVSEYVTLSLGVATQIPTENVALTSLMTAADQALYLAKKQGRNCVIAARA
jgi:diguanylate cyclase (GGDEF)-like protein